MYVKINVLHIGINKSQVNIITVMVHVYIIHQAWKGAFKEPSICKNVASFILSNIYKYTSDNNTSCKYKAEKG